jgi:capsular polysaccharide export protein
MRVAAPDTRAPLLRAPPFPGVAVTLSHPDESCARPPATPDAIDGLFAAIRDARVGGEFWALPAKRSASTILVRSRLMSEIETLHARLGEAERERALWLLPPRAAKMKRLLLLAGNAIGPTDPWSLLRSDCRLLAHGDDEWVALAVIAGAEIELLSSGRFGQWGDAAEALRERVARHLLSRRYLDPFTGGDTSVEATISQLGHWRQIFNANRDIVSACGIAWWKRQEIARFLWSPQQRLRFFRSERRAIAHAEREGGSVAAWPSRVSTRFFESARVDGGRPVRIEDGFVRSAGLGSNLVPPSSIAVDRRGIHYDPAEPSDLEHILANAPFAPELLERAGALRKVILAAGISKYGGADRHAFPARQPGRRLVLVPGQVEDDMSVLRGGGGLASNLELLRRARALEPDAEIWFRPHPDVDAGHRKGAVRDEDALMLADRIVRGGGMAALLDEVDAVHVLTSLTGFEALLRGREVTCHGTPFYAGWGLTRDLGSVPERRARVLTVDQLLAAVLILYPRYLDPVTGLPCEPEVLIARMQQGTAINRLGWLTRIRRVQGRLLKGSRR